MHDFSEFPNEDRFDAAAGRLMLKLEEVESALANDSGDDFEQALQRHRAVAQFLREEFGTRGLGDKDPVLPL